jgi:hypothetical protein
LKNNSFILIDFFYNFCEYRLLILEFFQLGEKKNSLHYPLNRSKNTLYVLNRKIFNKKGLKNNFFMSINFVQTLIFMTPPPIVCCLLGYHISRLFCVATTFLEGGYLVCQWVLVAVSVLFPFWALVLCVDFVDVCF